MTLFLVYSRQEQFSRIVSCYFSFCFTLSSFSQHPEYFMPFKSTATVSELHIWYIYWFVNSSTLFCPDLPLLRLLNPLHACQPSKFLLYHLFPWGFNCKDCTHCAQLWRVICATHETQTCQLNPTQVQLFHFIFLAPFQFIWFSHDLTCYHALKQLTGGMVERKGYLGFCDTPISL